MRDDGESADRKPERRETETEDPGSDGDAEVGPRIGEEVTRAGERAADGGGEQKRVRRAAVGDERHPVVDVR